MEYKYRLLDELVDLSHKIGKIESFMNNKIINEISDDEKDLLSKQFEVMHTYENILCERITYLIK